MNDMSIGLRTMASDSVVPLKFSEYSLAEAIIRCSSFITALILSYSGMAFASAVAEFGLILKDSPYKGDASLDSVIERALSNREADTFGYRAEFVQLADLTRLPKAE